MQTALQHLHASSHVYVFRDGCCMEIVESIINRKVGIMELELMSNAQMLINEILYKLDLVRHRSEIKWGVDRVIGLVSDELRTRWLSQMARIEAAIEAQDVGAVEELVQGAIRGMALMEGEVVAAGHVPYAPLVRSFGVEGVVYGVVETIEDLNAPCEPLEGRQMVSVEELVRVYHARHKSALMKRPGDEFTGEYVAQNRPFEDADLGF